MIFQLCAKYNQSMKCNDGSWIYSFCHCHRHLCSTGTNSQGFCQAWLRGNELRAGPENHRRYIRRFRFGNYGGNHPTPEINVQCFRLKNACRNYLRLGICESLPDGARLYVRSSSSSCRCCYFYMRELFLLLIILLVLVAGLLLFTLLHHLRFQRND